MRPSKNAPSSSTSCPAPALESMHTLVRPRCRGASRRPWTIAASAQRAGMTGSPFVRPAPRETLCSRGIGGSSRPSYARRAPKQARPPLPLDARYARLRIGRRNYSGGRDSPKATGDGFLLCRWLRRSPSTAHRRGVAHFVIVGQAREMQPARLRLPGYGGAFHQSLSGCSGVSI